jgi:hypothetical protein
VKNIKSTCEDISNSIGKKVKDIFNWIIDKIKYIFY